MADDFTEDEWDIIHALDSVMIMFAASSATDFKLHWIVSDREIRDDGNPLGCVHLGRAVADGDDLEDPYGEIYWAHKQARAKAMLRHFGAHKSA